MVCFGHDSGYRTTKISVAMATARGELIRLLRDSRIEAEALLVLEKEPDADEIRGRHLLTPADRQAKSSS